MVALPQAARCSLAKIPNAWVAWGVMTHRDRFDRPIGSLRLSVTDRCNLRCSYCMPEDEYVWLPRASIREGPGRSSSCIFRVTHRSGAIAALIPYY